MRGDALLLSLLLDLGPLAGFHVLWLPSHLLSCSSFLCHCQTSVAHEWILSPLILPLHLYGFLPVIFAAAQQLLCAKLVNLCSSITIYFFAKEGEDCILTPMKENNPSPLTVNFERGLGQKFRQSSGTGIDFSVFEESELLKVGDMDVYPLAVKADASPGNHDESDRTPTSGNTNSQITQAVFEKEKGEFRVKVVKQILWVNGMRYELQEIYGIGNSTEADLDESDQGKECVICLSEPRDTIVHPCRHMCMCSGCAKVLRFQTNRCPICRQPVERLLEIKVGSEE